MEEVQTQKIKIQGIEYKIVDSIQDLRAEDSFIHNSNKLEQFTGSGEARKYVGSYRGDKGEALSHFFDFTNWGVPYKDPERNRKTMSAAEVVNAVIQKDTCFFSKSNLLQYLDDAKAEYFAQEQSYHQNIGADYESRKKEIENLVSDYVYFSIYDVSDNLLDTQSRAYIRSDDSIWAVWRKLILPKISYLSILKLLPINHANGEVRPIFYFRILLDYQFRSLVHPSLLKEYADEPAIDAPVKKSHRLGQEKYRRQVIDHMGQCPFTQITDERLLIASHIKPYVVCMKEKREDQALHHLNGLALSPTYDKLFDQGFITFTDGGELICGTQLSPMTWSRLNINPAIRKKLRIFPEDREEYLDYHRRHVFQGNIDELL
jgi:putative restriction endonuclease